VRILFNVHDKVQECSGILINDQLNTVLISQIHKFLLFMKTYCLSQVKDVQFSSMCLQGPCLHTVEITVDDNEEPIVIRGVIGHKIARMLKVKNRRTGAHFNYFLDKWGMQKSHMNKEPIEMGEYTFTYPQKYKPTPIKEIKPPKPRASKTSGKGNEYCRQHGVYWCGPISLKDAKALVSSLNGGRI